MKSRTGKELASLAYQQIPEFVVRQLVTDRNAA
jgi:hypothetical protein